MIWNDSKVCDDLFRTPPPIPAPRPRYKWSKRISTSQRIRTIRFTPLRTLVFILLTAVFFLVYKQPSQVSTQQPQNPSLNINVTLPSSLPFQPPESNGFRAPHTIDTFATYKNRNICDVSSTDLHAAFGPLCQTRAEMIAAMSGGGRIGRDAPYIPRGCDMRWFTSEEVCEILGRFDRVVLVGDSMLRHVIGSINILVRKDIGYGAVTDWNFSIRERRECFCNEQFDVKACSVQGIYKTADVLRHDPKSLSCSNAINVIMEEIVRFPIPDDEIRRLRESIGGDSKKWKAFIFGHGLWSNLDLLQSVHWLDKIIDTIKSRTSPQWHGLLVTPNAAGKDKPDEWIVTQGNKALVLYEEAMRIEAVKRGIEHLGTWNMSIQANTYDGVHLDMKGNLVKAMMVMNWLNMLPVV